MDVLALIRTAEGRARLWTGYFHRNEVHQTSPDTADDRYPELFGLAARLKPDARRILSFGCSTGEELLSLRRRFPVADIIGTEINPRSRRIAERRARHDERIRVVRPDRLDGMFDAVFALAVLQREPHKIAEIDVDDLADFYPFRRFEATIVELTRRLRAGGLLCIDNAHYRVEDTHVSQALEPVNGAADMQSILFGADGRRIDGAVAKTMFRKL